MHNSIKNQDGRGFEQTSTGQYTCTSIRKSLVYGKRLVFGLTLAVRH